MPRIGDRCRDRTLGPRNGFRPRCLVAPKRLGGPKKCLRPWRQRRRSPCLGDCRQTPVVGDVRPVKETLSPSTSNCAVGSLDSIWFEGAGVAGAGTSCWVAARLPPAARSVARHHFGRKVGLESRRKTSKYAWQTDAPGDARGPDAAAA